MKIKDQIRARREQVEMSIVDLAAKLGVSDQAVRYWEGGRSNPGKQMARKLEELLGFQLDWTEGARNSGSSETMNALLDQKDIDLLLVICRLPYDAKNVIADFARIHLAAVEQGKRSINDREATKPIPPFRDLKQEAKGADKKARTISTGGRARRKAG